MGLGIGDFDTDGYLDIFKTHSADDTHVLYQKQRQGIFSRRDHPGRAGRGNAIRGLGRGDPGFRQRRLPDLFFTTGMVYPEVERKIPESPYKTPSVLFRNLGGGKFEELLDQAGPGDGGSALQPRRGLRRFR